MVEPVASNTASKLHRCVSWNGPVLKVWPTDNYWSCGVLEEHTKIFITLKELRIDEEYVVIFEFSLLYLTSLYRRRWLHKVDLQNHLKWEEIERRCFTICLE